MVVHNNEAPRATLPRRRQESAGVTYHGLLHYFVPRGHGRLHHSGIIQGMTVLREGRFLRFGMYNRAGNRSDRARRKQDPQ